jgi:nicotinamidase-related amidase
MQEGWCDATIAKVRGAEWMYDSQIKPVIANIKELLTTARSMGMPIIHVRWNDPPGAVPHPIYWELAPEAGELVLLKGGPGVFTGPLSASAIKYFTDYMVNYPKVKQFIVTGTVVNWCVLNTAIGIRWINATGPDRAGYSIVFAVDAVSGNAFLHSPTTPNPVVDYAYWWLYFADGGGAFGPSTCKLTKTDQITFT